MKKTNIGIIGMAVAALGMGMAPQTLPMQNNAPASHTQKHNDAVEKTPVTVRQGRPTALNPTGGSTILMKIGRTPKEYGQWLQSTGRQKWVKSKRK